MVPPLLQLVYPVVDEYVGVGTPVNRAWFYLYHGLFRQPEIDDPNIKTCFKELAEKSQNDDEKEHGEFQLTS